MILYMFLFIPVLIATLIYLIPFFYVKRIALIFQILLFLSSIYVFFQIRQNGQITAHLGGWTEINGIVLRADTLTGTFLILVTFLFLVSFLFGLIEEYTDNLFIFLFLILQSLILTLFLSSDLFNIYIVAEISTIVVSILIMFKKDSRSIYDGLIYLLTNIIGMTFFLFGAGFIYKSFGVLDIHMIHEKLVVYNGPQRALALPYAFLMTGVALKCAVMPVFSWLPKAHGTPSAPSIVSAILSGLYVKTGIYLFIRIRLMFEPVVDMDNYFLIIGIITALLGIVLALFQKDIKLILAYHTISQIGLILMGLSMKSEASYWGSILHIFNHALFKSALFLTAGIIIKEYGTRNIYRIKGVFKRMPLVSVSAFLAILGITGAPLFNGSISKYFLQKGAAGGIIEVFIILINLGTILSFTKYSAMFFGRSGPGTVSINPIRKAVVFFMGISCLISGIWGIPLNNYIFDLSLDIPSYAFFSKALLYAASLILGILLYLRFLKKSLLIRKGLSLELTFNSIAATTLVFFVLTLVIQLK